ncbi:MAG: dihydrodipicolinate synthase family protein [Clostridiales bacterium]|nr:dihydrodipicolinate synthase family protein [Clostridiales bacterium]
MIKRYPSVMMATALVPWNENYEFMPAVFEAQVKHMIDGGLKHIYLFGTAGEGYAVNNHQFETIVKLFSELMKDDILHPMVGLIDMSVARIKEKLELAYSFGIREFQFSLPCWAQLNSDEIFKFFDALLPEYPDCKFLNYNLSKTKRLLEPEELFKLAELHPNFVAVKQTRGEESDLAAIASSDTQLQFFVTERNFLNLSKLTKCGLLMSISNTDLKMATELFNACKNGDFSSAEHKMNIFWDIRTKMINLITFPAIDGVYDKLYTKFNVPAFPLRLLPPYQYATDQVYEEFATTTRNILKI